MKQKVRLREQDRLRRKEKIRYAIDVCILISLVGFGVVKGYEYLLQSPYLTLKEIKIQGTKLVSAEDIFHRCGIQVGQNILKIDLARIKRELVNFAEFRKVTIQRNLPHQVEIRIEERTPIGIVKFRAQGKDSVPARAGLDGKKVAFDCEGVKFQYSPKDLQSLPLVKGIVPAQEKKQIVRAGEIIQQLQQEYLFSGEQVVINMRYLQNPIIETEEFGEMRLGEFSPAVLQVKLAYLKRVVQDLERKNQQTKYIDLCFFEKAGDSIYVKPR